MTGFVVALLAGALLVQSVALGGALRGLLILPRDLPRLTSLVFATVAVEAAAWSFRLAPGWAPAVGLSLGVLVAPLLGSLRPLHPDRRLLAEARPLGVDDPAAQAMLLSPAGRTRAVVVVLHGGGNDRLYALWELVGFLLHHRLAVVVAHQAGHGLGGTDELTLESARRRVDAVLEGTQRALPSLPVFAVGQSWGGALLLDRLARGDAGLKGAVTLSAPVRLGVGAGVLREFLAVFRPALWHAVRFASLFEALPAVGSFRRERFPVRVPKGRPYVAEFARLIAELDLPRRLAQAPAGCPALVVHGTADGIVPARQAQEIAAALGPRARLLRLRWGTHFDAAFDSRALHALAAFVEEQLE